MSALVFACLAGPVSMAPAQTGGASPPGPEGGQEFGAPVPKAKAKRKARPQRLTVGLFTVTPTVQPGGAPAQIAYRIDGSADKVRVRIDLVNGAGAVAKRLHLGYKRTNRTYERAWSPAASDLPAGGYTARLHAVDPDGKRLVRSAGASGVSSLEVKTRPVVIGSGVFPVRGAYDFGGEAARFGDDRGSHVHQGQDIMAAEGTPVVTPRAGVIFFKRYQADGAGHYLVVRGDDGRDYVFMHLVGDSILVVKGDRVAAGQEIAAVGSTGRSSGPHLHFEIWPDGWFAEGSAPIDPRPELDAWAAGGS
jgi:murein DD-endopeptidase MepM/ murein hydrolase activator NlpD